MRIAGKGSIATLIVKIATSTPIRFRDFNRSAIVLATL